MPLPQTSSVWTKIRAFGARRERQGRIAEALRNERHFNFALKHSPITVYTCDRDLRYTWMSNPPKGSSTEMYLGRRPDELVPPECVAEAMAFKRQVLASGRGGRREVVVKRPDGVDMYFDLLVEPLRDDAGAIVGLSVAATDVSSQKQTEAALRKSESFLKQIIENSSDCIKVLDRAGRLVFMSPSGLKQMGVADVDAIVGMPWVDLYEGDGRTRAELAMRGALAGELSGFEVSFARSDGHREWWDVTLTPVRNEAGVVQTILAVSRNVSEARQAAESLRISEERLRVAIESTGIGTWDVNLLTGERTRSERVTEVFGPVLKGVNAVESALPLIHKDDVARFRAALDASSDPKGDGDFNVEYRVRGYFDGIERWVAVRGKSFFDEHGRKRRFIGTMLDISERKRTEEALRQSAERFRLLVEANPIGVLFADVDGKIREANDAFLEMMGHTRDELENGELACGELTAPQQGEGGAPYEKQLVRKDGTKIDVLVGVAFLGARREAAVAFVIDISERKRTEEALRRAKEDADLANRAKSAFLANMSHEIRTPLGVIKGFAELAMMNGMSETDRLDALATIGRNAEQLGILIDDILDLSKIEAGRLDVERLPCEIGAIIKDLTKLMVMKARDKGIAITVTADESLPRTVVTDDLRLRQCLLNVVGNAIKFTERGCVEVKARCKPGTEGQMLLEFVVTDTGIGLSKEQQARLFQPFVQADNSTTRKFGGTGLGLFLTRSLARSLGGDLVIARSEPGAGSTFVLTVAANLVEPFAKPTSLQRSSASADARLMGLRVLLVEDAPDNRALVGRMLRIAGIDVDVAVDGSEGVGKALAGRYDAVLLDIQMPGMDGHEAAMRLRATGYAGPLIALTAHAMKGEREKSLAAGFNDHLTKPIDREALLSALARHAQAAQAGVLMS